MRSGADGWEEEEEEEGGGGGGGRRRWGCAREREDDGCSDTPSHSNGLQIMN